MNGWSVFGDAIFDFVEGLKELRDSGARSHHHLSRRDASCVTRAASTAPDIAEAAQEDDLDDDGNPVVPDSDQLMYSVEVGRAQLLEIARRELQIVPSGALCQSCHDLGHGHGVVA